MGAAKKAEVDRKKREEANVKKSGPREERKKGTRYKGLKYDEKEEERKRAAKRAEKERRKKEEAKADLKKAGPRGQRIKYKGTKLDYEEHGSLLADKTSVLVGKKGKRASVVKGPKKKSSSKKKKKKK